MSSRLGMSSALFTSYIFVAMGVLQCNLMTIETVTAFAGAKIPKERIAISVTELYAEVA